MYYSITKELSMAAMGKLPADTVILGAQLVNVYTGEIYPADIAIYKEFIAYVGDVSHMIGSGTKVIHADGLYALPGFMDGHLHIESSMLTVGEYSRVVLPRGTCAVFPDPHEIANVLGVYGIDMFLEDGEHTPLKIFTTMPSCVPACAPFETSGAAIPAEKVVEMLGNRNIFGLGEVMNYPAVVNGDPELHKMIDGTLRFEKTVTGHFTSHDLERELNAYIAAGVRCCHESTTKEEALAKLRLGLYIQCREGSASKDLVETCKIITEDKLHARNITFVTDDAHADTLLKKGHLDYILKKAVSLGVEPVVAVRAVTINVADCFGVSKYFGSISPGKFADINLVRDLKDFEVVKVVNSGELIAEDGKLLVEINNYKYPAIATDTMRIRRSIAEEDFLFRYVVGDGGVIGASGASGADGVMGAGVRADVNVVELFEDTLITKLVVTSLPVENGNIMPDVTQDVLKAAVFDRHTGGCSRSLGFIKGIGLKTGALATTVMHDSHNLLVVGTNDADMAVAANMLCAMGGGQIVVEGGRKLAGISLKVAGLMSENPAAEVLADLEALQEAAVSIGCLLEAPFMTLSFLALPVIPEARLTDKGLVDSKGFRFLEVVRG